MVDTESAEALRIAFDETVRLYNAGDVDAYMEHMDDSVTYALQALPELLVGKAAVRAFYEQGFARTESWSWEAVEPRFLVSGPVGMVFSGYRSRITPKEGPANNADGRHMVGFRLIDGRWLKVGEHI